MLTPTLAEPLRLDQGPGPGDDFGGEALLLPHQGMERFQKEPVPELVDSAMRRAPPA